MRENVAQLGNLASDFDFNQKPRPPLDPPAAPALLLTWAGGRARPQGPGARAPDRLARLRRERRRTPERIRRLRPPRVAGRHRARARDEGEAQPRRGARGRRARRRARCGSRRRAQHYPACGGCRFQDLAYEVAGRGQGGAGGRCAAADRRDRGAAARADRPGGRGLPLPQQARVLVHADAGRGRRSASTGRAAGTRCSTSAAAG